MKMFLSPTDRNTFCSLRHVRLGRFTISRPIRFENGVRRTAPVVVRESSNRGQLPVGRVYLFFSYDGHARGCRRVYM